MPECRDLEPVLTPYIDGVADADVQARVDAHLRDCLPCRDRVSGERAAREVLRSHREVLRACASEHLRRRCAAYRQAPARPAAARAPRPWLRLSLAATVLLAVGGFFFFGLNQSVELLAAQLALDHVKCFQFTPAPGGPVNASILARQWQTARGWSVKIPDSAAEQGLELIAVRRCGSTEGITAHLMYMWRGSPLSVYILNSASPRAPEVERFVEKLGQEAAIWSAHDRTYAVVARGRPPELEAVVKYVKAHAK